VNKVALIVFGLVIFLVSGFFVLKSRNFSAMRDGLMISTQEPTIKSNVIIEEDKNRQSDEVAHGYQPYSEAIFNVAKDKTRILLFHAAWCPTCQSADRDITSKTGSIPESLVIFRTDYDSETILKQKYGITYQHTFVQVNSNGDAVNKWYGGDLDQIIKQTI